MSRIVIIAKEKVAIPILSEPEIQEKTKQLFNDMQEKLNTRFNELREYLHVEPKDEFSDENLLKFFEFNFFYEILGIAADIALTGTDQFNLKENLIVSINEENLNEAISGEPMIEAFKDAINSTPIEDAYDRAHRGCLIFNLETMDNKENPFAFPGNSEQKCTVKRDDEKAKEFYENWPNVLSPQWKDGKFLGCKKFVEGEESNDSKEELKGISEYLKDDIDD